MLNVVVVVIGSYQPMCSSTGVRPFLNILFHIPLQYWAASM